MIKFGPVTFSGLSPSRNIENGYTSVSSADTAVGHGARGNAAMKKESRLPLILTVVFLVWVVVRAYNYVQDYQRSQNYAAPTMIRKAPQAKSSEAGAQTVSPESSSDDKTADDKLGKPQVGVPPVPVDPPTTDDTPNPIQSRTPESQGNAGPSQPPKGATMATPLNPGR
jgi:hypothetical protein